MGRRQDDVARLTADVMRRVCPPAETVGENGERLLIRILNVRLVRKSVFDPWTIVDVTGSGTEHMTRSDEWRGVYGTRRGFRLTPELQQNLAEVIRIIEEDAPRLDPSNS